MPPPSRRAGAAARRARLRWLAGAAVAALLLPHTPAPAAAAFPAREVTLVVPNEPGGGLDLVARLLAKALTPVLGHGVVVVNRSGASGNIGTASVARAEPDGHTLLLTGVGHLVSPLLHSRPGYDPLKDFVPVAKVAEAPNVMVVHESLKGHSLPRLLDDARSRNADFSFGSAGYGHSSHLAAEAFMARTGARWLHVPYRGTAPATKALAAGEVQIMFVPAGTVQTVIATGLAHAVAVAHPRRLDALPTTPTLAELGVQGADFSQWYGLFAPAGTPESATQTLGAAIARWLADPQVRRQLHALGLEPAPAGPAEFSDFLGAQARRLSTLVRQQGVEGTGN